ncbi:MAG: DUF1569 domain-containing protein [Planctomycetota bacterium]
MSDPTPDRRTLHFDTLDQIVADAEAVTNQPHHHVGNWTPAQIIEHVTIAMRIGNHGVDWTVPLPIRLFGWFMKKTGATRKPIKPGFTPPTNIAKHFAPPEDITLDTALQNLRDEVAYANANGMHHPSPLFGKLTPAQWIDLHCRHAELHFSFIVPGEPLTA